MTDEYVKVLFWRDNVSIWTTPTLLTDESVNVYEETVGV